jgi:hypothetical protein
MTLDSLEMLDDEQLRGVLRARANCSSSMIANGKKRP